MPIPATIWKSKRMFLKKKKKKNVSKVIHSSGFRWASRNFNFLALGNFIILVQVRNKKESVQLVLFIKMLLVI